MKGSQHNWLETWKVAGQACLAGVAYLGIIALVTYPVFSASNGLV